MQNYCMNCMRKLGDSPVCSHCGYDNSNPGAHEPLSATFSEKAASA